MIYFDWLALVIFICAFGYCGWVGITMKEREYVLWIAAAFVFLNEAIDISDGIFKHYEEQPVVKEVRV